MKACPFCAEEIQDAAIVCKHCGADLVKNLPKATTVVVQQRPWSKGVAAVLSLFFPGAGQVYKGQILNGFVWFVVVVIGYAMLIAPGIVLHFCCIVGAYSGSPEREAEREQQREARTDDRARRLGRGIASLFYRKR